MLMVCQKVLPLIIRGFHHHIIVIIIATTRTTPRRKLRWLFHPSRRNHLPSPSMFCSVPHNQDERSAPPRATTLLVEVKSSVVYATTTSSMVADLLFLPDPSPPSLSCTIITTTKTTRTHPPRESVSFRHHRPVCDQTIRESLHRPPPLAVAL